jgi:hypothetical protein
LGAAAEVRTDEDEVENSVCLLVDFLRLNQEEEEVEEEEEEDGCLDSAEVAEVMLVSLDSASLDFDSLDSESLDSASFDSARNGSGGGGGGCDDDDEEEVDFRSRLATVAVALDAAGVYVAAGTFPPATSAIAILRAWLGTSIALAARVAPVAGDDVAPVASHAVIAERS